MKNKNKVYYIQPADTKHSTKNTEEIVDYLINIYICRQIKRKTLNFIILSDNQWTTLETFHKKNRKGKKTETLREYIL